MRRRRPTIEFVIARPRVQAAVNRAIDAALGKKVPKVKAPWPEPGGVDWAFQDARRQRG